MVILRVWKSNVYLHKIDLIYYNLDRFNKDIGLIIIPLYRSGGNRENNEQVYKIKTFAEPFRVPTLQKVLHCQLRTRQPC